VWKRNLSSPQNDFGWGKIILKSLKTRPVTRGGAGGAKTP